MFAAGVLIRQVVAATADAESCAFTTNEFVLPVVGVPLIAPVDVFRLKPAGRDPVMENV